ncbi:MAG TPA: BON domain-containing protein [Chryseosolibacter sp.]
MDDQKAGINFPLAPHEHDGQETGRGYNSGEYYRSNRALGGTRLESSHDDAESYDDFNSGKEENYDAEGYYGSNYGSTNELNRGRDVERNAGYRDNYNHLPTGQWPEVEEAAARRGIDLHWQELQARGVHRGKGPRSYQRSDERIREDIHDVLMDDPYIDATDVEVKVENGEVILTGMVEDRNMKRRAEDIIESQVSGIRHFENRLHTKFPGGRIVNVRTKRYPTR